MITTKLEPELKTPQPHLHNTRIWGLDMQGAVFLISTALALVLLLLTMLQPQWSANAFMHHGRTVSIRPWGL